MANRRYHHGFTDDTFIKQESPEYTLNEERLVCVFCKYISSVHTPRSTSQEGVERRPSPGTMVGGQVPTDTVCEACFLLQKRGEG